MTIKNAIQFILAIILLFILAIILIFIFNPRNIRNQIIGVAINSYLTTHLDNYHPLDTSTPITQREDNSDKHPILNAQQEATLESFGVDVSSLPTSVSPDMQACFVAKLGQQRVDQIIAGATPNAIDLFKAKDCL